MLVMWNLGYGKFHPDPNVALIYAIPCLVSDGYLQVVRLRLQDTFTAEPV